MDIVVKNEYRVEVGLTDAELEELGVRFEQLDYGNVETRRALWTLVGELRRRGIEVRLAGRVLIEAEKTGSGCLLAITVLPPRGDAAPSVKQLVRAPRYPAVFVSAEKERLARPAALLGAAAESALFFYHGVWLLCVEGNCGETALLEAEEYLPRLTVASPFLPAWLREHARALADGNAAAVLCAPLPAVGNGTAN